MASSLKVERLTEEDYEKVAMRNGMGGGMIDKDAASASWLLTGDEATAAGAKAALKGGPVGAFVIYSPSEEPRWKYRLTLKAPEKKRYTYDVVNSPAGFRLVGSKVATPTLTEFVAFYSKRKTHSLPTRLVEWGRSGRRTRQPPIGQRRALLVALSYAGQTTSDGADMHLPGCLPDSQRVAAALSNQYSFGDIQTVNDAKEENAAGTMGPPTRDNILRGFEWLLRGAGPGDRLFLHYAGHATRLSALDPGCTEETACLIPLDYAPEGSMGKLITDEELHEALIKPLPEGAELTLLIDACYSGNLCGLEWTFDGRQWANSGRANTFPPRTGLAVCFSACSDTELAADATTFDGRSFGFLTDSWLRAVGNGHRTLGSVFAGTQTAMTEHRAAAGHFVGHDVHQSLWLAANQRVVPDYPLGCLETGFPGVGNAAEAGHRNATHAAHVEESTAYPRASDGAGAGSSDSGELAPGHADAATHGRPPSSTSGVFGGGIGPVYSGNPEGRTPGDDNVEEGMGDVAEGTAAPAPAPESPDDADDGKVGSPATPRPPQAAGPTASGGVDNGAPVDLTPHNHLAFLQKAGNEVTRDTLVDGLGEGWLTVDDIFHKGALVVPKGASAAAGPSARGGGDGGGDGDGDDWRSAGLAAAGDDPYGDQIVTLQREVRRLKKEVRATKKKKDKGKERKGRGRSKSKVDEDGTSAAPPWQGQGPMWPWYWPGMQPPTAGNHHKMMEAMSEACQPDPLRINVNIKNSPRPPPPPAAAPAPSPPTVYPPATLRLPPQLEGTKKTIRSEVVEESYESA